MNYILSDSDESQILPASTARFISFNYKNYTTKSNIFCYTSNNKLYIIEPTVNPDNPYPKIIFDLPLKNEDDYPVIIEFIPNHNMIYILSNKGQIILYDFELSNLIYEQFINDCEFLISTYDSQRNGLLVLSKNGDMFSFTLDKIIFINYLKTKFNNVVTINLATRCSIPLSEEYLKQSLDDLIKQEKFEDALIVCSEFPDDMFDHYNYELTSITDLTCASDLARASIAGVFADASNLVGGLADVLTRASDLAGSLADVSNLFGVLARASNITGTLASALARVLDLPGTLTRASDLTGASDLAAALAGASDLAAALAGASDLAAALAGASDLAAALAGASDLAAALAGASDLAAALAGASDLVGAFDLAGVLARASDLAGASKLASALTSVSNLAGASKLAGALTGASDLAGALASASDLAGVSDLAGALASASDLAGALAGASDLAGVSDLAGALSGASDLTGRSDLSDASDLTGAFDLVSALAGTSNLAGALAGASDLASNLAFDLTRASDLAGANASHLASALTGASDLAGALTCASNLAGALAGTSDLPGALTGASDLVSALADASDFADTLAHGINDALVTLSSLARNDFMPHSRAQAFYRICNLIRSRASDLAGALTDASNLTGALADAFYLILSSHLTHTSHFASNLASDLNSHLNTIIKFLKSISEHHFITLIIFSLVKDNKSLLQNFVNTNIIICNERLGDLVMTKYIDIALSIFIRSESHKKVLQCYAELGEYDEFTTYVENYKLYPDYSLITKQILCKNLKAGCNFIDHLINQGIEFDIIQSIDFDVNQDIKFNVNKFIDYLISLNQIKLTTTFLLYYLKDNKSKDGYLQTILLEINLINNLKVAEDILSRKCYSHYDKSYIGTLCEQSGLYKRALEHYTDIYDIKRTLLQIKDLPMEFLIEYLQNLPVNEILILFDAMLANSFAKYNQICIKVSITMGLRLDILSVIDIFEKYNYFEGVYCYLGSIINNCQIPEVHYKYIQLAFKTNNYSELERICKESNYYNPELVKNFLKESNLNDRMPLLIVCNRFRFIDDLIKYLYSNQSSHKFIDIYINQVNSKSLPKVIDILFDLNAPINYLNQLVNSAPADFSIEELWKILSNKNELKIIQPLLEKRINSGSIDTTIHTMLAKVYISLNINPERFLTENQYYNTIDVGKYSEPINHNFAILCYQTGKNDINLIRVCKEYSLFEYLARYLVTRKDLDIWELVLSDDNIFKRQVIDHVIQTALPEAIDTNDISVTLKAFMKADLPHELVESLERLMFENSTFSENIALQTLLIIIAIKYDQTRVKGYLSSLNYLNSSVLAKFTMENELYEEAFVIYEKFNVNESAIDVLVNYIQDLDRAHSFAESCADPNVYFIFANGLLNQKFLVDAINAYILADNYSNWDQVAELGRDTDDISIVIKYLRLAREKINDQNLINKLLFFYDKIDKITNIK